MIEGLKPYAKYKESGQKWLGTVPAHWDVKRLKNWVSINGATLGERTPKNYEFLYLDIGSVVTGRMSNKPSTMRFGNAPSRARRLLRSGDTIVSTVRTYLKAVLTVGKIDEPLIASTGFAVLTPRGGTVPGCIGYATQSDYFTNQMTGESVGIAYPAISETRLANILLTLPPPDEQAAIVRFLDHANRKINGFIQAKRKLITLLGEQKQGIIHRAVTRGVNPNIALKPSGVPWVDTVPENWTITPNRRLFQIRKRIVGSRHRKFQVLSLTKGGVIVRNMEAGGKFSSFWERSQEVRPGNMVFCFFDVDETPRSVGLSRVGGMISPDYTVMECPDDPIASFLELFYIAMDDHKLLKPLYTGLRKRISKPLFLASKTPIPSHEELRTIINYVKDETVSISKSSELAQKEIAFMQEYRTRLTADVVTGKLDVRAAAAKLPMLDEEPAPIVDDALKDDELNSEQEAAVE